MDTPPVEIVIRSTPDRCFSAFCDAASLPLWVPGMRRAKIVRTRPDGLPLEVLFEYGRKLSYSVIYDYDLAARRVSWRPGIGRRDAVAGWAEFLPDEQACRVRYQLEARSAHGRDHDDDTAERLVAAFTRWVEQSGR